jgi:hypothetical protein
MKKKNEKLSKIETIIWLTGNLLIFKIVRIYFSRIMMTLSILSFPKLTHFFSFNNKLPSSKDRIKEKKNYLDDWIFKDPKHFKDYKNNKKKETVCIFFKRSNKDFEKYRNKKIKKFLVNWEKKEEKGKNIFYATADGACLSYYILNEQKPFFYAFPFTYDKYKEPYYIENEEKFVNFLCPSGIRYKHMLVKNNPNNLLKDKKNKIIFMSNKLNRNGSTNANPGSGITIVLALLKLYEKVNVYGLDLYQTKEIHKQSFIYALFSLSRHFKPIIYQENHMENLIYQYIYLSKISNDKNVKIHGLASKINLQKKLIKNLKKIIYK